MGSRVQGSHRDTSHSTAMASETTDIRVQSQHLVLSTGVAGFPAEQDQSLGSQGLGVEGFPMPKLGKQRGRLKAWGHSKGRSQFIRAVVSHSVFDGWRFITTFQSLAP